MLGWAIVGTGWPFSAVFCPTEHVESCQFQLAVYIKQTRRARKNTEDLERDRAPSNKRKELHKCGEGNCERDRKLAKTKLTTTWRYNHSPESSSRPRKQTTATWWYEDLLPLNRMQNVQASRPSAVVVVGHSQHGDMRCRNRHPHTAACSLLRLGRYSLR